MENFEFYSPTRIIFGKGTENGVSSQVAKYADKVLLVYYGNGTPEENAIISRIESNLTAAGIKPVKHPGVKPNPRLSLVRDGIRVCREEKIGFVLAIGGGSVIDTAKAIGVGVPFKGDVWDLYEGKTVAQESLPVGVVLTIPAAGSESSNSSVITNEDGWFKKHYDDDIQRPVFAILNPELTFTLPRYQTVCGACDIMMHIMERYFTDTPDVDLTDRLCESALQTIIKNAPVVMEDPLNYAARAEIMLTGTVAHNNSLGVGRLQDWASHMMAHELGGMYDVAHGAALAVIFPAWMKYVYKHNINRFAQYASRVWHLDIDLQNPEKTALEGIGRTEQFFGSLGLPVRLKDLGIGTDRIEEMAKKIRLFDEDSVGRFVKLKYDDVVKIYKLAAE